MDDQPRQPMAPALRNTVIGLVALAVVGAAGAYALSRPSGPEAAPAAVLAGAPSATASESPSPAPTPSAAPSPSPSPAAAPKPSPTKAPTRKPSPSPTAKLKLRALSVQSSMDSSRYIVNITATVSGSGSVKLWITVNYGGGKDLDKTITLTGSTGQLTRTVTFDRKTLCPSADHNIALVVQPYPGGDPAAFDQASC